MYGDELRLMSSCFRDCFKLEIETVSLDVNHLYIISFFIQTNVSTSIGGV